MFTDVQLKTLNALIANIKNEFLREKIRAIVKNIHITNNSEIIQQNFLTLTELSQEYLIESEGIQAFLVQLKAYLPKQIASPSLLQVGNAQDGGRIELDIECTHALVEGTPEAAARFLNLRPELLEDSTAQPSSSMVGELRASGSNSVASLNSKSTRLAIKLSNTVDPSVLMHLWHVPPPPKDFIGRKQLLIDLKKCFSESEKGDSSVVITACHGLGGIGKTYLATQYVYENEKSYTYIFWCESENTTNLYQSYLNLATVLKLPIEGQSPENIIQLVKGWLEKNPGWLLVYDNVPDAALIEDYCPRKGGKILITSRKKDWDKKQSLAIDVFSMEEACDFISKTTQFDFGEHEKDIKELATILGCLPLALAQACAYIEVNKEIGVDIPKYLEFYEENRKEMLEKETLPAHIRSQLQKERQRPGMVVQHGPVAITWQITFKAIREQHPASLPLLVSCAYLQADDIPEFLLKALFNEQQPDKANQLKPFIEALGCLQQYGILKLIAQAGEKAFRVHRLVQEVIFVSLAPARQQSYLEQVSVVLTTIYPYKPQVKQKFEDYLLQSQLLAHLEALLNRLETYQAKIDGKDLEVIREKELEQVNILKLLTNGYGNPHLGNNVQRQKVLLERALSIKEKHYSQEHPEVAKTLVNLGNAYGDLGDAKKKKTLLERALSIFEKHDGAFQLEVATTLTNLAIACSDLGDAQQQKTLLKSALLILEKKYGVDQPETTITLRSLGNAYGSLGDAQQKKKLLERALSVQEKHYGTNHVEVAITLDNLGNAYGALGDAQQQKILLERALIIFEKHYGADHPEVAKTLVDLGSAYGALGDALQQKSLLESAHVILEKHYGPEHPKVAKVLVNLGDAYGVIGDVQQAKTLLERALVVGEKYYGADHPQVAKMLVNLGNAYGALGDVQKKKTLLERALVIGEKYYGADHVEVAIILGNLGAAYVALGDALQQKELLERALSIFENHYGVDHREVASVLINLGNAYGILGDTQKAKVLFERSLVIQENWYGADHPKVAITLFNLAVTYQKTSVMQKATELMQRAYHIFLSHSNCGPLHPHTQQAKALLDEFTRLTVASSAFFISNTSVQAKLTLVSGNPVDLGKQLRNAANQANVELLTQLLRENKALNLNAQDNQYERSALHWAVVKAAIPCIKVLLQAGANIDLQDVFGKSSLDYACELQDSTVSSVLLSQRYQLPLEGKIDISKLLRRAAHEGDADVIQRLLEKWPNKINEKDQGKTERTALHWAVIKGHVECVKILLAAGADASIGDKENYSAIDWAKKLNHVAINQLLESIPSTNFFQSSVSSNEASSSSSTFTLRPGS